MIIPTVGRIIWFYNDSEAREQAAIITRVFHNTFINVMVFEDCIGVTPHTSIPIINEGCEPPYVGSFCRWMPYQLGQAKKTEEMAKELEKVLEDLEDGE